MNQEFIKNEHIELSHLKKSMTHRIMAYASFSWINNFNLKMFGVYYKPKN